MSADLRLPDPADSLESADFALTPEEVARGRKALETYLENVKAGDPRQLAAEALDIVAAVISGGRCSGLNFPWQQVRGYHVALSLSIIKEMGTPSRVEALLCRHNDTRKFQQVSDRYPTKMIYRMSTGLNRVLEECRNLGFLDDEEFEAARRPSKVKVQPNARHEREVSEGEVRALIAASVMDTTCRGPRDALMIGLAYSGGLRTVDLVNLNLDDMHFDGKTGRVTVKFKAPGAKRARRIALRNDQLIALEDWLGARDRKPGPLFCPVARGGSVEIRRMGAAEMRDLCAKRAERAGVMVFAPNDLARSGLRVADANKRRGPTTRMAKVSPLYEDHEDESQSEEETTSRIHFPYRVRPGL